MELTIYQIDAFSEKLFGGNPAAVCPLKEWLPTTTMQKIALENNLSETAFIIREGNNFHIRWFTPAIEVDLCGHATLATAHALYNEMDYKGDKIIFNSRSGQLIVEKQQDLYSMNFPTDQIKKVKANKAIAQGLGVDVKEVYKGKEDYLVVVNNQTIIEKLHPNFDLIAQLNARGVIVTALGNEVDFVSRCFFPAAGINEDPVTGSAHTTLTPYWSKKLGKTILRAKQISARGGELTCEYLGERVKIAGKAVTYLKGLIQI